jgi:hypothetical protein
VGAEGRGNDMMRLEKEISHLLKGMCMSKGWSDTEERVLWEKLTIRAVYEYPRKRSCAEAGGWH